MKINGNDILLAIGEIDEQLLAYPERRSTHYRTMRTLSLVASLILCVSVVLTFYIGVVFKGATKEDNYYPGFDAVPPESNGNAEENGGDYVPSTYQAVLYPLPIAPDITITGVGIFGKDYDGDNISAYVEGGTIKILLPATDIDNARAIYKNAEIPLIRVQFIDGYAKYIVDADGLVGIEYEYGGCVYRLGVIRASERTVTLVYKEDLQ